jgi:hypothetical protein
MAVGKLKRWLAQVHVGPVKDWMTRVYFPRLRKLWRRPEPEDELQVLEQEVPKAAARPAPQELTDAGLLPENALIKLQQRIRQGGVIYACQTVHEGNSQVMYTKSLRSTQSAQTWHKQPTPGYVRYIFHWKEQHWLAVAPLRQLPVDINDPFQAFADFPARMYPTGEEKLELIEISALRGHFACFVMSEEFLAVENLMRVSSLRQSQKTCSYTAVGLVHANICYQR